MREKELLREIEREGEARALEIRKKYSLLAKKKRAEHEREQEEYWEKHYSILEKKRRERVEREVSRIRNGAKKRLATLKKSIVDETIREGMESFWNTKEYGALIERLVSRASRNHKIVRLVGAKGDRYLPRTGKKHGIPVSLKGEKGVVIVFENGMLDYSLSSLLHTLGEELEIAVGLALFGGKEETGKENRKTHK